MATSTAAPITQAEDPFADIEDEKPSDPAEVRNWFLRRAKRGYAELHRDWIQLPRGTQGPRGSALAQLVTKKRETALEGFLLLHALQPVLQNNRPLPMEVWAALLTRTTKISQNAASKAFGRLEELSLVKRTRDGRRSLIQPLAEDGSGTDWASIGVRNDHDRIGQGYFTLPFAYWRDGYAERLHLPAKAMLLILLSETQIKPSALIPVERAQEWYGVSERTAERGYRELSNLGILHVKRQARSNPEVPGGQHHVYHRALATPFSTQDRSRLQSAAAAVSAAKAAAGRAAVTRVDTSLEDQKGGDTPDAGPPDTSAARS